MLLAFNKVDRVKFNEDILSTPFSPNCYSNVNCLLYQWYNWINEKIERLVPNLEAHKQLQKDLSGMLLAFNKVDRVKFNEDILSTPFSPNCYSNVNCLLYQWYNWINEKIERLVPRVTKHRASLKPWISRETSHKIKKLNSLKRKLVTPNLSKLLKIKKFEKEIKMSAVNDLKIIEAKNFQTRCFSHIQKYLASIRKNPLISTRVINGDQSADTDHGRSELYNDYFVSVFNEGHSTTEICFPRRTKHSKNIEDLN